MSHTDVELNVGVRTLDLEPAVHTPTLTVVGLVSPLRLRAAPELQLATSALSEAS